MRRVSGAKIPLAGDDPNGRTDERDVPWIRAVMKQTSTHDIAADAQKTCRPNPGCSH